MKGADKVFFSILGRPLLFYTVKMFENHPKVNKIILVAKKKNFKKIISVINKYKFKKIGKVVLGGKERQDSAFSGLRAAKEMGAKKGDLILFHNVANPMVSQEEITEVLGAAKKHKTALLCQPAKDTVKEVNKNGFIVRTLDRKKLFLAQVPQVIEYDLAKKAFYAAAKNNFYGTDDVSLAERLGAKVKVVPASYRNIKVTTREDLKIIKAFLSQS